MTESLEHPVLPRLWLGFQQGVQDEGQVRASVILTWSSSNSGIGQALPVEQVGDSCTDSMSGKELVQGP